jgi:hypothetical protein
MIIRNNVASATEDENPSKNEDQCGLSNGGIAKNQITDWMAAASIHIDGDPCSVTLHFSADDFAMFERELPLGLVNLNLFFSRQRRDYVP